jgi:hypothetical protein
MMRFGQTGAPRPPIRLLQRFVRGAIVTLSLGLAGAAAASDCPVSAEYGDPTRAYPHGVLGDDIEYRSLTLIAGDGRKTTVTLSDDRVFEDIRPRLADLDGDSCAEVITVESQFQTGAQLSVYNGRGEKIAATPHIGQRNRWLAPIGAADLDGDGKIEIAYIDRPHLAKILRVWRFDGGMLTQIASAKGLTNHRIGWDYIEGGIRDCGTGPELITASGDWRHVQATRLKPTPASTALGPYSAEAIARALRCE